METKKTPAHEQAPHREDLPRGGRYRLLVPHIIDGAPRPAGTEIGEGTDIPYDATPSNQMEGVDDAGKKAVNELHQKLYGREAPWHAEGSPLQRARAEAHEARQNQREELKSEPVSHQQAWERGHREFRGEPVKAPHERAPVSAPTISGDTSVSMGPATARQDITDPELDPRPRQPLKDQLPV